MTAKEEAKRLSETCGSFGGAWSELSRKHYLGINYGASDQDTGFYRRVAIGIELSKMEYEQSRADIYDLSDMD